MVYVDELCEWGGSATFRWKISCHMWADSVEELVAFAKRIGLKAEWLQTPNRRPHFDLNASRRAAAVKAGAVEATRAQLRAWVTGHTPPTHAPST